MNILQGVPTQFLILCRATMTSTLTVPKKLTINEKKLTVNIVKILIENYGDIHLKI